MSTTSDGYFGPILPATVPARESPGKRVAGKMEPARCRPATVTLRAVEGERPDDRHPFRNRSAAGRRVPDLDQTIPRSR